MKKKDARCGDVFFGGGVTSRHNLHCIYLFVIFKLHQVEFDSANGCNNTSGFASIFGVWKQEIVRSWSKKKRKDVV